MEQIPIHEIPGFYFGQAQDLEAATGCTLILCPEGAVCGVDVRGGSPGTRDTDALDPKCNRESVHGVLLTGGSAYGLDAAGGVMKYLEQKGIGRSVSVTVVPNVCAAVLFDLKCGRHDVRPDVAMGMEACANALEGRSLQEGNFGAGTGATIGKIRGGQSGMKGGIGACAFRQGDLMVGAVIAVNAMGDVVRDGKILAGARKDDGMTFLNSQNYMIENYWKQRDVFSGNVISGRDNTVIGCVITNAALGKSQMNKLAGIAQNGIARAVYPAHSTYDGDTMFAMRLGDVWADANAVGALAALAAQEAVYRAVEQAGTLHGFPGLKDWQGNFQLGEN